ncbi:MAG: DUF4292 domain-containing protein [Proteobacteria bacterium]|nr:DUF4292 domain-containing protein [Pseudomonadota bacterium]
MAWLLVLLHLGGCLPLGRPYPAPPATEILRALEQRALGLRTVRAEARVLWESAGEALKTTLRLLAAPVGRLRFDLISPFDNTLATWICRDGRFALRDARTNRHYFGPASPCNLARIIGVALEPAALQRVLAGSTPVIAHQRRTLRWSSRAAREELTLYGATLTQTIALRRNRNDWDVEQSSIFDSRGRLLLRLSFAEPQEQDGLRLPALIKVEQPPRGTTVALSFRAREANLVLPARAFELPAARGLPSEEVRCTSAASPGAPAPARRSAAHQQAGQDH